MFSNAQKTTLRELSSKDSISNGNSIIYGNFIQRLGFSSGGFPQDITLKNIDSGEILIFRVKPTFKSAKENIFCYFIKPGNYMIENYWWTQSTWYGGKMFTEPIFKEIDATDNFEIKIKSGEINQDNLKRYTFKIEPNTLNYLGTWDFDKGLVRFKNDKADFDKKMSSKFKKLEFKNAETIIPD